MFDNVDSVVHVYAPEGNDLKLHLGRIDGFNTRAEQPTHWKELSVKETNKVLGFIRGLKAQNVTGIFISHNMHHVFQSCDRIVAMARGEIVFDRPVGETSVDEVQDLL